MLARLAFSRRRAPQVPKSNSTLQNFLASALPLGANAVVGLSGGMDSVVLLHAVKRCLAGDGALRALHVNHGLRADADEWEWFCRELCRRWDVALTVRKVAVPKSGASPENRARSARYEAFSEALAPGECLLLAHHLDDQMETMLLRLSRGAGLRGLSGIPARRELGEGALLRPLLRCPREALANYAQTHNLRWIEDASNRNIEFDRNFCRHEILPALERRWPEYRRSWERSRELIAESRDLAADLAEIDIERCAGGAKNRLGIHALRRLSAPRQRNALRRWIEEGTGEPANPGKLRNLLDLLIGREQSGGAAVDFGAHRVRRFNGSLHLVPEPPPIDPNIRLNWNPSREPILELPGNGSLHAIPTAEQGLAGDNYEIRYRQGGESCRLARRPTKSLKKILNEARLAPWLRHRLPLLFAKDELAAIPGIGIAGSAAATPGLHIEWRCPPKAPAAKELAP